MTTKVNVDAHAGWPVEVTQHDRYQDKTTLSVEVVPANTAKDFYITDTRQITSIREMKRPE